MNKRFICICFNKNLGKWRGQVVNFKPAERSSLPPALKDRTILTTDNHEAEEDAARAVDRQACMQQSC